MRVTTDSTPPRSMKSALGLHFLFAAISILLNVASQIVTVAVLPRHEIVILFSIGVGTTVGLVTKYLLDKFVIYKQSVGSNEREVKKALTYTASGGGTTLLFWMIEYGFHLATQSDCWRYFGAVLGLTIGYTIKFFVDRKLVFQD